MNIAREDDREEYDLPSCPAPPGLFSFAEAVSALAILRLPQWE